MKTSDHATGSLKFRTRREVTKAYYEQCKKCHFANYTKAMDGVHEALVRKAGRVLFMNDSCFAGGLVTREHLPLREAGLAALAFRQILLRQALDAYDKAEVAA